MQTTDGLRLHVVCAGPPDAPALVFLHGISLSGAAWAKQFAGPLSKRFRLVAPDLRGQGASDKPADRDAYQDGALWAEDVRAVLEGLTRPLLVAHSYGGIVALEYLSRFQGQVAGLVLVGALARNASREAFGDLGPSAAHLQGMMQPDFETQYPASRAFVRALTHAPLPQDEAERLLALSMMTPPYVRRSLGARKADLDGALAGLGLPVLVIQGEEDAVVRPEAGARLADLAQQGRLELLPNVGHSPFLEVPETFDAALADFAAGLGR